MLSQSQMREYIWAGVPPVSMIWSSRLYTHFLDDFLIAIGCILSCRYHGTSPAERRRHCAAIHLDCSSCLELGDFRCPSGSATMEESSGHG